MIAKETAYSHVLESQSILFEAIEHSDRFLAKVFRYLNADDLKALAAEEFYAEHHALMEKACTELSAAELLATVDTINNQMKGDEDERHEFF
jgi:hypothetical protein